MLHRYCPSRLHVQDEPLQDALAQHYRYQASRYQLPCRFSFLSGEHQDDFEWAMNAFKRVAGINSHTWPTDRQLALKNTVKVTFPNRQQLLCL